MKKNYALILAATIALAGCSTPPTPPEGKGIGAETTTIAFGKVLNVKEYALPYGQVNDGPNVQRIETKQKEQNLYGKFKMQNRVEDDAEPQVQPVEPPLTVDMVELHIENEQGLSFKIDQRKNGSYYMGQRIRITMKGNIAKVTAY